MALFVRRMAARRGGRLSHLCLQRPLRSLPSIYWTRTFGTDKNDDDKEDYKKKSVPAKKNLSSFAEANLRGVGQVIFINSPTSGLVMLGGLALGDPYLAALAAVGTVTATGVASVRINDDSLQNGLWGYNGCLVGCAASVFMYPLVEMNTAEILSGVTATIVGAAATPLVVAGLKPIMGSIPQWTFAFNIVTLSALLYTQPLANSPPLPSADSLALLEAPLRGISQIFVVDSSLTGAALLGGMALYSPGLAGHALLGSTVGASVAYMAGMDLAEIGIGLWGFNSALTSMAVGTFFCHSKQTVALSVGGAAATAGVFGVLKVVFGAWNVPCLTLPFCITMTAAYVLGESDLLPGIQLASNPHSPEQNEP